ncbi:MAG TPA: YciI family protein [Pseudonocardiaceae bacterium]|jgi:hypothetical protein|nr:YciI family protein [Pseudonocardiaceae bacterium]
MILIHSNPATRQAFDLMSDDDRLQFARDHQTLGEQMMAAGEFVHSEGLLGPEQSTWVSMRDDEIMATDGPFAEVKEYLAGFYIVDCATLDRAVHYAARLPEASSSHVEVRPIFDYSTLDL